MTREERDKAIRILQWLHCNNFLFKSTEEDVKYATNLAMQSLEQEPQENEEKVIMDMYGKGEYNNDKNILYDDIKKFLKDHPVFELIDVVRDVIKYEKDLRDE